MVASVSRRFVMLRALAVCAACALVVSGLLLIVVQGTPEFVNDSRSYDRTTGQWHVEGQVRFFRGGRVRTAHFSLAREGQTISSEAYEEEAIQIARLAEGRWTLNIAAFVGGWLILAGVFWLLWFLVRYRLGKAAQHSRSTDAASE